MSHVLLLRDRNVQLNRVFDEVGIPFDEDELQETYSTPDGKGRILINDLVDVYIFQTGSHTALVLPKTYMNDPRVAVTQKRYIDFMMSGKGNESYVVYEFKRLIDNKIGQYVWKINVPVLMIENRIERVATKRKGEEDLRVASYMISNVHKPDTVLHLDLREIFELCKSEIDTQYIVNALTPTRHKNVLVTIFKNRAGDIVGMRTTDIIQNETYEITGAYACGPGYGEYLQMHTENLIRGNFNGLFPMPANKEYVNFSLRALPASYGFWNHIGFEDTGRKDDDGNAIMTKRLYPISDTGSQSTKRQRRSK